MTAAPAKPVRLAAALRYAALGWRVFPCHWVTAEGRCSCGRDPCPDRPGKHPLVDRSLGLLRGCKDASSDPDVIARWWGERPDANPAVATGPESGVWVLGPDGEAGVLQLGELLAENQPDGELFPATPLAASGSGGRHLYFRWPADGLPVSNRVNHRGLKIDVRGAGGYVVAPPGVNANGRYEWHDRPWDVPAPEAPAWLLAWVRGRDEPTALTPRPSTHTPAPGLASAYGRRAVEDESRRVAEAAEGTRHAALVRSSFKLGQLAAGGEVSFGDAESAMRSAGLAAKLPEAEVLRTVRDGVEAGSKFPRSAPPRDGSHSSPDRAHGLPAAPRAGSPPPGVPPPAAPPAEPPPQTGVEIILSHFRERYAPDYRRGNAVHAASGEMVPMTAACAVPTSALIARLAGAADAPRTRGGDLKTGSLPGFFTTWARVAWGDLLASLPDEDQAELAGDTTAAEEFRRLVKDALLTEVVLGDTIENSTVTQTERRSLIDWCVKFARPGPWRSIRSKKCWCKAIKKESGEIVFKVALRAELFGQLRADKRLTEMSQNAFARRAARYGVGEPGGRSDRPHGLSAVVLAEAFLGELTAGIVTGDEEPLTTAEEGPRDLVEIWSASEKPNFSGGGLPD